MAKNTQETNAALEKTEYTFDHKGNIMLVKKNTRFASNIMTTSYAVKNQEEMQDYARKKTSTANIKRTKSKVTEGGNEELSQFDSQNMMKMFRPPPSEPD